MTEEHFIFLLLGKTGNGKSATGNSILGSNEFYSDDSSEAVTRKISIKSKVKGSYRVTVIDTPGFMDTNVDENEAKSKACADMRRTMGQCPTNGKLALVVVLKYGDRDTHDNKLSLHILKQIFGEKNLWESCIIVMTHGDAYITNYEGKKCFNEWMKERTGDLGDFIKMCGYNCLLFCNKTVESGLKENQFQKLIGRVKTLNQSYTLSKFEREKKQQCRMELEAELPKLKEYYDKEIERMHKEIKKICDCPQTRKEFDEMDSAITQLLNDVNKKDSPEVIFYADGERRLLEKSRYALNEIKRKIDQMFLAEQLRNKIVNIKKEMEGINANEIEIESILSGIRTDVESLDLTKFEGELRREMAGAVDILKNELHTIEMRVTHFLKLENDIQVLTKKYNSLETPCQVKRFGPLHTECDMLLKAVMTFINNSEDRAILLKRLEVIKNAINDKKKENDMCIASIVLLVVPPIAGPLASLGVTFSTPTAPVVKHNKQKELEEAARNKQCMRFPLIFDSFILSTLLK